MSFIKKIWCDAIFLRWINQSHVKYVRCWFDRNYSSFLARRVYCTGYDFQVTKLIKFNSFCLVRHSTYNPHFYSRIWNLSVSNDKSIQRNLGMKHCCACKTEPFPYFIKQETVDDIEQRRIRRLLSFNGDYSDSIRIVQLQWRNNGRDGVSNHQPQHCLLNRLIGRRSKRTSKLRVTGLCEGNSPVTGDFSAQMASNAENVSICWRHLK